MTIERSTGIPIAGTMYRAGGGYRGFTDDLDAIVAKAAERLEAWSGMDVTIRFNSDRKSGSAFLLTDPVDGIWKNAELGVGGGINDSVFDNDSGEIWPIDPVLYVSTLIDPICLINPGAHDFKGWSKLQRIFDSLDEAFAFVEQHATIERL